MTIRALELFAGAGGLGMGLSLVGVKPVAVVEWDAWACDTLRENQKRGYPLVLDWPVRQQDVRALDLSEFPEGIELVTGGPPCQPFSMGGKHQAFDDTRDMFPATVDIIAKLKPRAFLIENVKGLTRSSFANYYQYILSRLEYPDARPRADESWTDHFRRLQAARTSGGLRQHLAYYVAPTLVNAANYGVPQKRERVFIIGFRRDLGIEWSFPHETHSLDALLFSQWVSGEYWDRHGIPKKRRPCPSENLIPRIRLLSSSLLPPHGLPWRTTRDGLAGLPDPRDAVNDIPNHRFQPGARAYPGHTGSPLDLPAKTLKAGDHGVPGGENMLAYPSGELRYFTVREAARLQGFPDGYVLHGSWTETMRQLGNAVPVHLARVVAASIVEKLEIARGRELARDKISLQSA